MLQRCVLRIGSSPSYNVPVPDDAKNPEPDPFAKSVGNRIQQIMTDEHVSQADMASRLGVSPAYVWRVVDGRQNLSLRLLGRICLALGRTPSELFSGIAVPPSIAGNRPYARKDATTVDAKTAGK